MQRRNAYNRGESLVEVVISIGIFAVAGFSILLLVSSSFRGVLIGGQRTRATAYMRETWEGMNSIGRDAYNLLRPGTYGLSDAGGTWAFSGSSDTNSIFTRSVLVEAVNRDGSGNIAVSGTNDIHARKVTATVSWMFETQARTLTWVDYFMNWDNARFFEDTTADFSDGTFSDTQGSTAADADGAVALSSGGSLACVYVEGSYNRTGTVDANDVAYSGTTAYVVTQTNSGGGEFLVIDFTTPTAPTLLGSLELNTDATGVSVWGQHAFVTTINDSAELVVINITVPASPSQVGTLDLSGAIDALDIVASGSYAYLARSGSGAASLPEFYVISVSTPSSPSLVGTIELGQAVRAVALSGSYIYAVTDVDTAEFRVLDVTTPTSPSIAATVDLPSTSNGQELSISGSYAYVVTDVSAGSEFYVMNISTPTSPSITGSLDLGNGATSIAMDGTDAFIGTTTVGRTLQIVNAATPSAPVLSNSQDLATSGYNGLVWTGSRLLAASADDAAEFQIIRRESSTSWRCLELKGTYSTSDTANANAVFVSGTKAYFVTSTSTTAEFFIVDVTTPTSPSLLGSLELGAIAKDVVVSGDYAYVASSDNSRELTVINVTNPAAPTLAGAYNASGTNDGLAVGISGTKALLGTTTTFFEINVAIPTSPALLGSVALAGAPTKIRVLSSSTAYVSTAGDSAEVQVVNISTNTPSIAGSYNATGTANGTGLWIKGTQLFLGTLTSTGTEFYILNITSPNTPVLVGSLETGGDVLSVAADDDETYAFATTSNTARPIHVIDISVPAVPFQTAAISSLGAAANDAYFLSDYLYAASSADAAEFTIYGKIAAGSGYLSSGTYISSIFNATDTANWNTIEWSENVASCPSGDIRLQVRSATTSGGLASELWQGPDGEDADETDYFTDPIGDLIHYDHNSDQYFQYRASLSGDGTCTPHLTDITVTYTIY